jgi:hypothetical protein
VCVCLCDKRTCASAFVRAWVAGWVDGDRETRRYKLSTKEGIVKGGRVTRERCVCCVVGDRQREGGSEREGGRERARER